MADRAPVPLLLSEVSLERFKAAFKPKNPIILGAFNVVIGRNGSGKSTIIEALQWIDTAIRIDVSRACDPYNGVHDLVNARSPRDNRFFQFDLKWDCNDESDRTIKYGLRIGESYDGVKPIVVDETLWLPSTNQSHEFISTSDGLRWVQANPRGVPVRFLEFDRLALGAAGVLDSKPETLPMRYFEALRAYWSGAVFLRLNPIGLAQGSRAYRKSYEALLDQEGRLLPALLAELNEKQLQELIRVIQLVLPDMADIRLSRPKKRGDDIHFSLLELVKYRGRAGKSKVTIPSWMLSEGTRRITAILALLRHDPPPTLLCIEEIENGLDPWSVQTVLKELRSAARKGVQVVLTSHSPWLLDHVEVADILHVERQEGETVYSKFADKEAVKAYQGRVPPGAIYVTEG